MENIENQLEKKDVSGIGFIDFIFEKMQSDPEKYPVGSYTRISHRNNTEKDSFHLCQKLITERESCNRIVYPYKLISVGPKRIKILMHK